MKSQVTTLCYIEREDSYLMLHRVKKKNDLNENKWVGIGGHAEEGEESGGLPASGGNGGNGASSYFLPVPGAGHFCVG